jgi:hypothetical protein
MSKKKRTSDYAESLRNARSGCLKGLVETVTALIGISHDTHCECQLCRVIEEIENLDAQIESAGG